jgi:hypothetical protein
MRANLKTARRAMVDSNPSGKSKSQPRALGDFKRTGRDCKTTSVARPDELSRITAQESGREYVNSQKLRSAGKIRPYYGLPEWVSCKDFPLDSADSGEVGESRTRAIALLSLASCSVNQSISAASTDLQRSREAN